MERNTTAVSANNFYVQFIGSENSWPYKFGYSFTDGIKFIAEQTNSFWFIDVVISYKFDSERRMKDVYYQHWTLQRIGDTDSFLVEGRDDNMKTVITQKIEFSDFPFNKYEVMIINNMILLPSEN